MPAAFAALRFGLTAFPALFFVPRPDVRWRVVIAFGHRLGQFGVLFVAMNTGLPAGLASVLTETLHSASPALVSLLS